MFKKSSKQVQLDFFASVTNLLESSSCKQYSDESHWHNQFREQITMRIDESVFSVLYNKTMGVYNSPKGYSMNITETCSDEGLNLITSVVVDKANTSDAAFVKPAIEATNKVTDQQVEMVYADGAYQSPANDEFCKDMDMVFTGIQGVPSKYDLQLTKDGLLVTDTETGEQMKAVLVKNRKNSKEDKWRIKTSKGYYYFNQQAIRTSHIRRQIKKRPLKEINKRNNVEATIFQFCYTLRNNKSKYRGLIKQKIWSFCRCLWINFVRILNFMKKTGQKPQKMNEKSIILTFLAFLLTVWCRKIHKMMDCGTQLFITMRFKSFSKNFQLVQKILFGVDSNIKFTFATKL